MSAKNIRFRGKRIDHADYPEAHKWVTGHYFQTPLTDENSGTNTEAGWFFLSDGKERHCISDEAGVAYVIEIETLDVIR